MYLATPAEKEPIWTEGEGDWKKWRKVLGLLRFYRMGHGVIMDLAHVIFLRQGEKDPEFRDYQGCLLRFKREATPGFHQTRWPLTRAIGVVLHKVLGMDHCPAKHGICYPHLDFKRWSLLKPSTCNCRLVKHLPRKISQATPTLESCHRGCAQQSWRQRCSSRS